MIQQLKCLEFDKKKYSRSLVRISLLKRYRVFFSPFPQHLIPLLFVKILQVFCVLPYIKNLYSNFLQ